MGHGFEYRMILLESTPSLVHRPSVEQTRHLTCAEILEK
jgi:hypothetical protein